MNSHSTTIIPLNDNIIIRREGRAVRDAVCKGIVVFAHARGQLNPTIAIGDMVYFDNPEAILLEDDLWYVKDKAIVAVKKKVRSHETIAVNG
jgi:hypothetical protein